LFNVYFVIAHNFVGDLIIKQYQRKVIQQLSEEYVNNKSSKMERRCNYCWFKQRCRKQQKGNESL